MLFKICPSKYTYQYAFYAIEYVFYALKYACCLHRSNKRSVDKLLLGRNTGEYCHT